MAGDGFITAVGPDGVKRRVPEHYVTNPAFGYKVPAQLLAQLPVELSKKLSPPSGGKKTQEGEA